MTTLLARQALPAPRRRHVGGSLIARLLAVLALALGGVLVAPETAHAALNDAVIKNQSFSYTTITVCKDAISDTQCGATYGYLSPGQNTKSKYGWADADGIWCGQGWYCQVAAVTVRGSGTGWNSRFIKISGCSGCTMPVYAYPDRG